MIITSEKGLQAIEEFELLMKDKLEEMAKREEIDENAKIAFYSVSRLFESYVVFREYIIAVYLMFVQCAKRGKMEDLLAELILMEDRLRGGE